MKHIFAKLFSNYVRRKENSWINNAERAQEKIFHQLIAQAKDTSFGKDHNFSRISTIKEYQNAVPVRDYEQLKDYIDRVANGEENVLWPGKPLYLAKTSGTTSGTKYIPISKESMPFHIQAARNALLNYIHKTGKASFVNGKMIFLQGSPVLEEVNGIRRGRLSGIVAHFVPSYLQKNRLPSWETNCIETWEEKVFQIVNETISENMTLISGIPPWILMYFERLVKRSGKKIGELFPDLQLIVTGGVNFEPYRNKMNDLLGRDVDILQTYPASEGFIAYQDQPESEDLLLLLNHGIFYEFIPVETFGTENQQRLTLKEIEKEKNYALIMSTNAGLWSYSIGDTVKFTSLNPYRIRVTGRLKHYTSAFGEHVITQEVENALKFTLQKYPAGISEFHVAPQVNPPNGLPYHEWFIEFKTEPKDLDSFRLELDEQVQKQNTYYRDLIEGKILQPLVITHVGEEGFNHYMKSIGKLGGQFKLPRLGNDRVIADGLTGFKVP